VLEEPIDDIDGAHPWRAAVIWLTAIAALLPRRTRGAGTLALATLLSRAHAAARYRLEATLLGLFDERTSVARKLDVQAKALASLMADHESLRANGMQTLTGHHKRLRAVETSVDALMDAAITARDAKPVTAVDLFVPQPDPDNDSGASG